MTRRRASQTLYMLWNKNGFAQHLFSLHFCPFFLLHEKVCSFDPRLYTSISALIRLSNIEQKFFEKNFVEVQPFFEISLSSLTKFLNFYQYVTVFLVRIWTYKNADEKTHIFSRKKRKKTGEKRKLCKFTLSKVKFQYTAGCKVKLSSYLTE